MGDLCLGRVWGGGGGSRWINEVFVKFKKNGGKGVGFGGRVWGSGWM